MALRFNFLHEMLFKSFLAGNLKVNFVQIFGEKVARGNSVQIRPNFPAKSLSIYLENSSEYLFINLTENYLSN